MYVNKAPGEPLLESVDLTVVSPKSTELRRTLDRLLTNRAESQRSKAFGYTRVGTCPRTGYLYQERAGEGLISRRSRAGGCLGSYCAYTKSLGRAFVPVDNSLLSNHDALPSCEPISSTLGASPRAVLGSPSTIQYFLSRGYPWLTVDFYLSYQSDTGHGDFVVRLPQRHICMCIIRSIAPCLPEVLFFFFF